MHGREYNRLIEVWLNESTTGEFGDVITTETFVKSVWAKVKTNSGNKFVNFGIQEFVNPVVFSVRGVKNGFEYTENHFIKYQGDNFYIKGILNNLLENMEIDLLTDKSSENG